MNTAMVTCTNKDNSNFFYLFWTNTLQMISDDDEENEDTGGDNDVIMGRNSTTPSDNWRVKLGAPLVSTPKLLDCLESPEYRAVSGK